MTSITKILILITAIVFTNGESLDMSIIDTDGSSARVSYRDKMLDALSRQKQIVPNFDELDFTWPFWTGSDVLLPSTNADITNTKSIVSMLESRKKQQQALAKTKDSDHGSESIMPITSSSSPLRTMLRNRYRRSSSKLDTPSNKKTTVESSTLVNSETPDISKNKRILLMAMSALNPYFKIPPNEDYELRDDVFA